MAKKTEKSAIASVLSFEKKLVISDGYMYQTSWKTHDTDKEKDLPIEIKEKSVKGTISNRLRKAVKDDPMKLNAEIEKSNLQTVDNATLDIEHDTLKVKFTLKVLGNIGIPAACNNVTHSKMIREIVGKYSKETRFTELSQRYALNLANGRFLWRNSIGASKMEIKISLSDPEHIFTFNALDYPLKDFTVDEKVKNLAEEIASVWRGEHPYLYLEVTAWAKLGRGQEVYPSEELVLDKKKTKSKILYVTDGTAALHSQKIGNALRTIDDWYPDADFPIPIEVYGTVTSKGTAFRPPKSKKDFYTLFDAWSTGTELEEINDKHYVIATLIRGGVFGASGKE